MAENAHFTYSFPYLTNRWTRTQTFLKKLDVENCKRLRGLRRKDWFNRIIDVETRSSTKIYNVLNWRKNISKDSDRYTGQRKSKNLKRRNATSSKLTSETLDFNQILSDGITIPLPVYRSKLIMRKINQLIQGPFSKKTLNAANNIVEDLFLLRRKSYEKFSYLGVLFKHNKLRIVLRGSYI